MFSVKSKIRIRINHSKPVRHFKWTRIRRFIFMDPDHKIFLLKLSFFSSHYSSYSVRPWKYRITPKL